MRRSWIATALVALVGTGLAATHQAAAGGKPYQGPAYDDMKYNANLTPVPPTQFDYQQQQQQFTKGDPNAYGTGNWGNYLPTDQYSQYGQYSQTDQYSQFGTVPNYSQFDQSQQSPYDFNFGKGPALYPSDPGYDFSGRHPFTPPQQRGFFDYDFGRRFLVGTAADTGGYLMRDAVSGANIDGARLGGAAAASGIENFADYAGNYDRSNNAGARIASNAIGYGMGRMAYDGISGDGISGQKMAGGVVEGGIVGFGKYMGDEEPSAVNGLFWGGLTRFGGAMAGDAVAGDKLDGGKIGGEALRSVVGALGYMGGNEQ